MRTLFAACPELERGWRPRNPYKGLSAFEPADRANFFGRTALILQLADRVERERLVTLIGPSGGGKSSLIGAGLLPVLADRGGWRFIRIRPGVDPFDALAGALLPSGLTTAQRVEERRRLSALSTEVPAGFMAVLREWSADTPGTRLLLVVDQFEELFTNARAADPARARAFAVAMGALVAADPAAEVSVRLLLALRADFMGRAMDGPTAPFIAPERQCQVGPLDTEDLKAAILEPAAARACASAPVWSTPWSPIWRISPAGCRCSSSRSPNSGTSSKRAVSTPRHWSAWAGCGARSRRTRMASSMR